MNLAMLGTGLLFAAVGGYTVARPQRVADVDLGGSVADAELTDSGRVSQRAKGLVLVAVGAVVMATGLLV
jgi:hypothetical protein